MEEKEKKQIKDFTLIELKSAAYDLLAQQELIQRQLQAINQEIVKKSQTKEKDILP